MTAWSSIGSPIRGVLRAVRDWWAGLGREEWWVEITADDKWQVVLEHSWQGRVIFAGPFDTWLDARQHGLAKLGRPL